MQLAYFNPFETSKLKQQIHMTVSPQPKKPKVNGKRLQKVHHVTSQQLQSPLIFNGRWFELKYHPYSIRCGPIISARFHSTPWSSGQAAGVGSYEPAMPLVMPSYELRRVLRDRQPDGSVRLVRLPQTLRTPKEWWNYRGEQVRFR